MPVLFIGGDQDVIRSTQDITVRLENILSDFTAITIPQMGHVLFGLTKQISPYLKKTRR